ncbi:hypothetical protein BC827DRAFT_1158577 [Russula dissimulans]|nr:hypothetical protein BC827DRAFT_1158577 [Russula dissimulans]
MAAIRKKDGVPVEHPSMREEPSKKRRFKSARCKLKESRRRKMDLVQTLKEEPKIEVTKSCGKLDLKGEMMLWKHLDLQDMSLIVNTKTSSGDSAPKTRGEETRPQTPRDLKERPPRRGVTKDEMKGDPSMDSSRPQGGTI